MYLADHVLVGHEHVVEEDLAETGVATELGDWAHRDSVGLEVEHEIR